MPELGVRTVAVVIAAAPRSGAAEARRPRRLQRPRRPGVDRRPPEGAVYVGRPTLWTNPFRSERFGHARAIALHGRWLGGELTPRQLRALGFGQHEIAALYRLRARVLLRIHRLRGLDLQCWCPVRSRWCHADTLLRLANADAAS